MGIIQNSISDKIQIYPNPTNGNFSIDLGEVYSVVAITLTDLSEKVIQTKTYSEIQLLNLNLEKPTAEVYLLKIESAEKNAVIRLVKE